MGTLLSLLVIPIMHVAVDDASQLAAHGTAVVRASRNVAVLCLCLCLLLTGTLLAPRERGRADVDGQSVRGCLWQDAVAVALANNLTLQRSAGRHGRGRSPGRGR